MHHRNRTTTEAQYAPPYSHDTRRQKHSMHHRNRTTTEAQYAPPYSHDTRRPKHSLHLHIRTNTNHYELTCVATKSHHQHLMFTTVVSTVTSSVEPCDLNPPCLSKHVGFEPQHFVASTCPPSLPTAAARAMSVSVKGTATLKNGKVSLVLQPDVQDIRPDTRATATGSNSNEDDVQIDVRAAMMKKIADGLMPVHPSRSPISSRTLLVQICHAQEKQQFTKKGIYGQWDPRAESALAAALLKPKRNCKSTSSVPSALENSTTSPTSASPALAICNTPASNAQSAPENTNIDEAKADSSSSSSSSTSSSDDEQQEHSSGEDDQEEHDVPREPNDEQHEPDNKVMPEYFTWTDDWHDVYAQLLQIYDSSELNPKRRRIMDTLLTDLRKAKDQFDTAV